MNQKYKPIPKGSFGICIFIGVCALVFAIFFSIRQSNIRNKYVEVDATITSVTQEMDTISPEHEETYPATRTKVSYTYKDTVYNDILLNSHASFKLGESIKVYLLPTNPETPEILNTSNSTFIAFLALGILFIAGGLGGIFVARHIENNDADSIISEGNFIWADVDQVVYATEIDDREPVNSTHGIFHTPVEEDYDENEEVHHPYIIYCHYTNKKGQRRDYIVPNLWVSPYPYLEKHSNQVKVYIKGNNINRYRFDLSMFEEENL